MKLFAFFALLAAVSFAVFALNLWRHRKDQNPISEAVEDILDGDPRDMKAVEVEQVALAEKIDDKAHGEWKSSIDKARKRSES